MIWQRDPQQIHSDIKFKEIYLFWHPTTGEWIYYVTGLQKLYVRCFFFSLYGSESNHWNEW